MRYTIALMLCFLLTLPGVYAIIAWTLSDIQNKDRNIQEMGVVYKSFFPGYHGSFKMLIGCLIAACAVSLVITLTLRPRTAGITGKLFSVSGVLSVLTIAMLVFALM